MINKIKENIDTNSIKPKIDLILEDLGRQHLSLKTRLKLRKTNNQTT